MFFTGDYLVRQIDTSRQGALLGFPQGTTAAIGNSTFVVSDVAGVRVFNNADGSALFSTSHAGLLSLGGAGVPNYAIGWSRVLYAPDQGSFVLASTITQGRGGTFYNAIGLTTLRDQSLSVTAARGVVMAGSTEWFTNFTMSMDASNLSLSTSLFNTSTNAYRNERIAVAPLSQVFGNLGTASFTQVDVPNSAPGNPGTYGFSLQGVNSRNAANDGLFLGVNGDGVLKAFSADLVNNGSPAITLSAAQTIATAPSTWVDLVDQPGANKLSADYDAFLGASAFEHGGYIYLVQDVRPLVNGTASADSVARITVLRASDFGLVQQVDIAHAGFDVYNASIAVSDKGLVVGYNRSGSAAGTGNISVLANAYRLGANGTLSFAGELFLKQSGFSDYRGLSNRWGPYSSVSVDPNDSSRFYIMGHYATGRDTYGSVLSEVALPGLQVGGVPEPASWAMLIAGFGLVGAAARRRRMQRA